MKNTSLIILTLVVIIALAGLILIGSNEWKPDDGGDKLSGNVPHTVLKKPTSAKTLPSSQPTILTSPPAIGGYRDVTNGDYSCIVLSSLNKVLVKRIYNGLLTNVLEQQTGCVDQNTLVTADCDSKANIVKKTMSCGSQGKVCNKNLCELPLRQTVPTPPITKPSQQTTTPLPQPKVQDYFPLLESDNRCVSGTVRRISSELLNPQRTRAWTIFKYSCLITYTCQDSLLVGKTRTNSRANGDVYWGPFYYSAKQQCETKGYIE